MNILITPNNLYAGYAGVLLTSIFENSNNFFSCLYFDNRIRSREYQQNENTCGEI